MAKLKIKKSPEPRRYLSARVDARVASIERRIENDYGLPTGSVRLVLPDGRDARGDKRIGKLLADWSD